MSVLEFHIWGSRVDQVEKPDRIVFDLDPDVGLGFEDVRRAAFDLRDRLADLGLTTFPMLSGGKGFHVVAPLTRRAEWPEVKAFCQGFAVMLGERSAGALRRQHGEGEAQGPHLRRLSAQRARLDGDRALLDARARQRAGRRADHLERGEDGRRPPTSSPSQNMPERAQKVGDPWPGYFDVRQSITKAMMKAVNAE